MDLKKSLNQLNNLNGYINYTQELVSTRREIEVPFNMSTVLTLKKIRSFEVEYFSKHQESGAAFIILDRMMTFPPSKTWSLLSVEIVNLLYYWIEAVRKYLITHSPSWWTFFKAVLGFISEIRRKDLSISNLLLNQLALALLDLSTSDKLSSGQRSKVVGCLNQVCFHSSRDVRLALQDKCAPYLVKLASDMAACPHVPTQFAIIELLMRWLPERQDRKVRETAAARWFPATLYTEATVALFLERTFANFFKDARAFLNHHNSEGGDIISFVCRKLTVGRLELVSLADKWESWLDIGLSSGHLTAMVDVRRLPTLGLSPDLREHLTLTADNAQQAVVYRRQTQIQLSITTITEPQLICKETQQLLDEQACDVNIWISTKCHFESLDLALRRVFGDKYTCDENRRLTELICSSDSNRFSASEDDTRFSIPVEVPKRKRIGCVSSNRASGWKSPSTVSTTSLACLSKKLSAIPRRPYDKEQTGICVAPNLSCVTEISEPDDDSTYTFSGKTRPFGVVNRSKTSPSNKDEGISSKRNNVTPVINATRKFSTPASEQAKRKSAVLGSAKTSPNCLLSDATFGAYEASIINDTLEAYQLEDDDIVIDLLAQQAFATVKAKDVLQDSGIHVSDRKTPSSAVETRVNKQKIPDNIKTTVPCTVISKSSSEDTSTSFPTILSHNKCDANSSVLKSTTTDESNTEAINETPVPFVNSRTLSLKYKKKARSTSVDSKHNFKNICQSNVLNKTVIETENSPKQFAANDIDDFFSQHVVQPNKNSDTVLSPTLVRRVNETPSDTSDSFDKYLISNVGDRNPLQNITELEEEQNIVDPEDVFECLNQIIDKVCEDLDKCAEYMEKEFRTKSSKSTAFKSPEQAVEIDSDFIPNTVSSTMNPLTKEKAPQSSLKLTFKNAKPKKKPVKKNIRKNAKNQSPIKGAITHEAPEINSEVNNAKGVCPDPKPPKQTDATKNVPVKHKRKLYSPKDADKQTGINIPETEEDNSLSADINPRLHTPKTTATSYKEIFEARKNQKDDPKSKKTIRKRGKASKSPPMSPRSIKKNEIFDKLKENVESVAIKQVDKIPNGLDLTVYNYTSESEDEDFAAKKNAFHKNKGTPIGSTGSKRTTRSRVNYSESRNESSADDRPVKKTVSRKKRTKQPAKSKKEVSKIKEPLRDVVDEKMRVATDGPLNTSFALNDAHENRHDSDLEPLSKFAKRMEPIPEVSIIEEDIVKEVIAPKKVSKRRCERVLSLKKSENKEKINVDSSTNEDTSPLPALIIEPVKIARKDKDADSISSSKLDQKCEKFIKFGKDVDTTQNLLSDDDKVCYSPEKPDISIELQIRQNLDRTNDERIDIGNDKISMKEKQMSPIEYKRKLCKKAIVIIKNETDIFHRASKPKSIAEIEVVEIIDNNTEAGSPERSISTVGNSPIRAHGTSSEDPPNENMLKQQLTTHRDVNYDMSTSMKNFYIKLYNEININSDENENPESPQEKIFKQVTKKNAKKTVTKKQPEEIIQSGNDNVVPGKSVEAESPQGKLVKKIVTKRSPKTLASKKQSKEIMQSECEDSDKNNEPETPPQRVFKKVVTNKTVITPATKTKTKLALPSDDDLDENVQNTSQIKLIELSSPVVLLDRCIDNRKKKPTVEKPIDCASSPLVPLERYLDNSKKKPIIENPASLPSITSSLSVDIKRLDSEELRKWLPSPKSTISQESREVFNVRNTSQKPENLTEKQPESHTEIVKTKNITKSVLKKTKETSIDSTNISVENHEVKTFKNKNKPTPLRKSIISPLSLDFDEPSKLTDIQSKSVTSLTKHTSPMNNENTTINTRSRNITKVASLTSEISISKEVKQLDRTPGISEMSVNKNVTKIERKRKGASELAEAKKRRIIAEESVQDRAESIGSDWYLGSVDLNVDTKGEAAECLLMMLEKLDTTLFDIQHDHGKRMIHFFVSHDQRNSVLSKKMQSRFAQLLQELETVAEKIARFIEECARERAELDRAMRTEGAALLRTFKENSNNLVKILREDIQAALKHMERRRNT